MTLSAALSLLSFPAKISSSNVPKLVVYLLLPCDATAQATFQNTTRHAPLAESHPSPLTLEATVAGP